MENAINKKAFALVGNLFVKQKEELAAEPKQSPGLEGSMKERGFLDLSSKLDRMGISRSVRDGICNAILFEDENGTVGFSGNSLKEFHSLCSEIESLPEFDKKISLSFIEDISFEWMVKIQKTAVAQQSLIDHIKSHLENSLTEYQFFFLVHNIDIVLPFKIGNVEFTFFTEKHMDAFYTSLEASPTSTMTKEQFDQIIRSEFQGRVVTMVTVAAERKKAEMLAKRYAELAVDVLKIYSLASQIPDETFAFELSHRLGYPVKNIFLSKKKSSEFDYSLNLSFNNSTHPHFDENFLRDGELNGLTTLSNYIALNKTDELYRFIVNGIELLSFALSIPDMHRRAIALITTLESLFLEEDKKKDMEGKAKARLAKMLPGTFAEKE
ncbi:MAG TPA: hypothetical protein VFJ43_12675, partial [Bacteroidia bacterium]|nr:hypothetical protein [Bacteroidia bacterium]